MSRSQNRHDTAKWKKKRSTPEHLAAKCNVPKCPACHPHKFIGGNNKMSIKAKYRNIKKDEI